MRDWRASWWTEPKTNCWADHYRISFKNCLKPRSLFKLLLFKSVCLLCAALLWVWREPGQRKTRLACRASSCTSGWKLWTLMMLRIWLMAMLSSSRLAVLQAETQLSMQPLSRQTGAATPRPTVRCVHTHLPWKSRLSSLQALRQTSAELECLFIISTRLTWRPLDSSSEHILPAEHKETAEARWHPLVSSGLEWDAAEPAAEPSSHQTLCEAADAPLCVMSVAMALVAAWNTLGEDECSSMAAISCLWTGVLETGRHSVRTSTALNCVYTALNSWFYILSCGVDLIWSCLTNSLFMLIMFWDCYWVFLYLDSSK